MKQPKFNKDQICPKNVCWTPYDCENGRCTESEKLNSIGFFNGKFRAENGALFFEVKLHPDMPLPSLMSPIYDETTARRNPLTEDEINNLVFPESGKATIKDFVRVIESALGFNHS